MTRFHLFFTTVALGLVAICAPARGSAAVAGSLGGGFGPIATLGAPGLSGALVASLTGGAIYTGDQGFAHPVFAGRDYLASGSFSGSPSGTPALLTFANPVSYFSFAWGSPDSFDRLELTTTSGNLYDFTGIGLGFPVLTGEANFGQLVQFTTTGEAIISAKFLRDSFTGSFESAGFSGTVASIAAVPEPSSWATLTLGVAGIGAILRKCRARGVSNA